MIALQPSVETAVWEIKDYCAEIRRHERDILYLAFNVGRKLAELKDGVQHGEWEMLEQRIASESHTSIRTLRRYKAVYEALGEYRTLLTSEQIQVGLGVLYVLSSPAVTHAERQLALGMVEHFQVVTVEQAQEIVATSRAIDALPEGVREEVTAVVMRNGVHNPEVVARLGNIAVANPMYFEEIQDTGMVELNGEQLPLRHADQNTLTAAVSQAEQIAAGETFVNMLYGRGPHVLGQLKHVLGDKNSEYRVVVYKRPLQ